MPNRRRIVDVVNKLSMADENAILSLIRNSRHTIRKVVWKSSMETWCKLHEEAPGYFAGAPQTIRLDNLKGGVIKPDVYDAQLNTLYAKPLEHHGVVPLPCRPYASDLKGKVESAVGHRKGTGLKGRRFESLEEQNAFFAGWNGRWAATRIHGTTKRRVRIMFDELSAKRHGCRRSNGCGFPATCSSLSVERRRWSRCPSAGYAHRFAKSRPSLKKYCLSKRSTAA
jgi:hypothetical protein